MIAAGPKQFNAFPGHLVNNQDIDRQGLDWTTIDRLDKVITSKEPVILNHDTSKGPGTHWTTILYQRSPIPTVYYYDPLGPKVSPIPRRVIDFARHRGARLVSSPFAHQPPLSNLCGYFAVVGAKLMHYLNMKGMLTPRSFTPALYMLHGATPDKGDVLRLLKLY